MGTMVHSLLWVIQDLYHQTYQAFKPVYTSSSLKRFKGYGILGFEVTREKIDRLLEWYLLHQ